MTTTGTGSWRRLRLGTRGSRLALTQSGQVAEALRQAAGGGGGGLGIDLVTVRTDGDGDRTPLRQLGGVGVFAARLRHALLDGEVDLVVEGWVVVELDGYTYHCDEYQFGLDRWRDRRLVARGFLPLRFTRKDVYAHQVVPDVRRALERWGVSKSVTKAVAGAEWA